MNGEAKLVSVGNLFRQSWSLYRERTGLLTKIILLPVAFLLLGDILYFSGAVSGLANFIGFIGTIISFFAYLALILALQGSMQWREAYRSAWARIWSYGWIGLLSGFAVLGGFVMLIIPGIIFSIWFAFAVYIFALEGEKGMNALLRSRQYVRGYWWQVFGRQLVFGIAASAVVILISLTGTMLAGERGASLAVNLLILVLVPVGVTYVYTLYQNLKSLKPEVASQLAEGPRGFFYFSAVLGVLGIIVLVVLMVALLTAYFFSGGLEPDVFQLELPQ